MNRVFSISCMRGRVEVYSSFIVLIFKEFLTCKKSTYSHTCSAFTLASSELGQTGLVLFSKVDISKVTARYTCEVPAVVLVSAFKNKTKPVWPSSAQEN